MTLSVTIISSGVTDEYGRALTVGSTQSLPDDLALAYVQQQKAAMQKRPFGNLPFLTGVEVFVPLLSGASNAEVNTSLLQSALSIGGDIRLPFGKFYVNVDRLQALMPGCLTGVSRGGWKGDVAGTTIATTSQTGDLLTVLTEGFTIQNVALVNEASSPSGGSGIKIGSTSVAAHGFMIDKVSVRGFYDNIYVLNGAEWCINMTLMYAHVRSGLHVRNYQQTDNGDQCVSNCFIAADVRTPTYGIFWESGSGIKIINTKINWHDNGGTRFKHGKAMYVRPADSSSLPPVGPSESGVVSLFLIQNCSFESFTSVGLHFDGTANTVSSWANITIQGCEFQSIVTDGARAIRIEGSGTQRINSVSVDNNLIQSVKGGIFLEQVDNISIGINNWKGMFANAPWIELGATCMRVGIAQPQTIRVDTGSNVYSAQVFQDSSAAGSQTFPRLPRNWVFSRDVTAQGTTDTVKYHLVHAAYNAYRMILTFNGKDNLNNVLAGKQERIVSSATGNVITLTTVGTDVAVNGSQWAITYDTATDAGDISIKIKAAGTATTIASGLLTLEIVGELYSAIMGYAYNQ